MRINAVKFYIFIHFSTVQVWISIKSWNSMCLPFSDQLSLSPSHSSAVTVDQGGRGLTAAAAKESL